MNLSKAQDCLPHDLLALALITDYLTNSNLQTFSPQRVKIGATFSSYLGILRNVSQKSILAPILFNLFINDFVFFIKKKNRSLQFCR